MKFTLVAFLALSLNSMAQTVVLTEGFEQGIPNNWTIIVNDTNTLHESVSEFSNGWISLPDPSDATDTVIGSSSYFATPASAERWIFTPAVNLLTYGNYLSWKAKSHDPSYPDNYRVLIGNSPDIAGMTDTIANIVGQSPEWTDFEVNLSELGYQDQTVYLAFVLTTFDGFKLYLDDIEVRGNDPVSVKQMEKDFVHVYPNPSSDFVHIKAQDNIYFVELIDLNGLTYPLSLISNQAELSRFGDGFYFLRTYSESGVFLTKLEIKH